MKMKKVLKYGIIIIVAIAVIVLGAGSVVTKNIPSNVVAVGNPCRVIKKL